ncbi:MAG: hydrogenase maturation nickel metallochaperone HypA [Dissulfurispiraceae bacterium]|jgi:hydrogenase nickel incorporation protein HypA/HybF|nr:hydrogenase maturation nickel metallochaperone HypA [Dissulfurispiraceae bacterium]
MHEVSVAESLLKTVIDQAETHNCTKVDKVIIKIGRASGIVSEALTFAFDALKPGTIAQNAVIEVIDVPVSGICHSCGSDFNVDEKYVLACPCCGSPSFKLTAGAELELSELEVN